MPNQTDMQSLEEGVLAAYLLLADPTEKNHAQARAAAMVVLKPLVKVGVQLEQNDAGS